MFSNRNKFNCLFSKRQTCGCVEYNNSFLLHSAGVSQWQSSTPSVPVAESPPCNFHWTLGCVCFGRHMSTKRGAHPYIPSLIPPLNRHRRGPLPASPRLVPAWLAGLTANRAQCPTHGTPAEWAYWRGNRLALSVPDGYPALLPAGPPPPPLSLSTNQGQSLCLHLSNTNYQCVVDLREWQKPLLGNLYKKGEVMLSVVLFLVRLRLVFCFGFFSLLTLFGWCVWL